jgi:hypothetical protein
LSSASLRVWGVAGVAVVLAGWHGWGIAVTPERSDFWGLAFADVVVAAVAVGLGMRWPRSAYLEPDGLVLRCRLIRYEAITEVRFGDVSAKPFWLAFWLPTSLIGGLIVFRSRAEEFNRRVIEIGTADGRVRLRWRRFAERDDLLRAIRTARPDLSTKEGLDEHSPARDYTPKLSVGGGLLAAALVFWAFIAGWWGVQLLDRSTVEGPYSTQATSAVLRAVTSRMTGYSPLPGVSAEYTTQRCTRVNNALLGPSPDVVDLHVSIEDPDVPSDAADAVEARFRRDAGIAPDEAVHLAGLPDAYVDFGIPLSSDLDIEIRTGCVDSADLPALRKDVERLVGALGVGR